MKKYLKMNKIKKKYSINILMHTMFNMNKVNCTLKKQGIVAATFYFKAICVCHVVNVQKKYVFMSQVQ